MRRLRLPIGRSLFLLLTFLFALFATLPLRVAADWLGLAGHGFAARDATGSVWLGAFDAAQVGTIPLGNLAAQLRTAPLLLGRARMSLSGETVRGAATATMAGFGFDDVSGRLALGGALAPLPIAGLELTGFTARFAGGACVEASGQVRAQLAGDAGGMPMPPALVGNARCHEGALLLTLASQSGMEQAAIRIGGDGRWRADLLVRSVDPAVAASLAAAGFRPAQGGHALRAEGRF